jgi:hypothetical protein
MPKNQPSTKTVTSGSPIAIRFMPNLKGALDTQRAASIEEAARANAQAFMHALNSAVQGELSITFDEARAFEREHRDHGFASAAKRALVERITNALLDHASDRVANATAVEDYVRRRVAELSEGTPAAEVVSVQLAESLERLDHAMAEAYEASAFASAVLAAAEAAGLSRFERRDYSYASRKAAMPRDSEKPVVGLTERQRAQLARLRK